MKSCRSISLSCLVLSLCVQAQNPTSLTTLPALKKGLIVEQVTTNSQAQRAGVRPGDVLLGWKRGSVHGDFQSPFDLAYIFLEQAPRGPITITAIRGGQPTAMAIWLRFVGVFRSPQFFRATSVELPSKRTVVCLRQVGGSDGADYASFAAGLPGDSPSLAAAMAALSCWERYWWVRGNGNWQTRFTRKPWPRQPMLDLSSGANCSGKWPSGLKRVKTCPRLRRTIRTFSGGRQTRR